MQWLKDFINSCWVSLQEVLSWMLDGIITLIKYIFFFIFDGFLTVIETLLTAIDFSSILFTSTAQWSSMPTQLIWLINHLALPQGLSFIASALVIRKLLDLFLGYFTDV
jgi:hypothetical protein